MAVKSLMCVINRGRSHKRKVVVDCLFINKITFTFINSNGGDGDGEQMCRDTVTLDPSVLCVVETKQVRLLTLKRHCTVVLLIL